MRVSKKYNACLYARLSRDDGDMAESDSITSQKALIQEFVTKHPEITIVSEKVDDGYSGASFERPAFQEMMQEIRTGVVNCVLVKDLSRFGRNYIEAGNYIEKVFPFLQVRFIAINDDYDSLENRHSDSLIVPFKNLINDAYCKDISVKVRTQLEVKRKQGQFIGAFTVYGYMKDPENHNHLVPDTYASEVVRAIFRWTLHGMSQSKITDKLNSEGILSPLEYKLSRGIDIQTGFCKKEKALWTPMAVKRILENETYAGVLVQGKSSTPNHKVKKSFRKDASEWIRVEGTHEPVVDPKTFWDVQNLLGRDVRTSPGKEAVYPFSGYLYCADCGQSLVRRVASKGNRKYVYYICSTNKAGKGCSGHSVSDKDLTDTVLSSIRYRGIAVLEMTEMMERVSKLPVAQRNVLNYELQIKKLKDQIERNQMYKMKLFESLQEGVLNKQEFARFKAKYDSRIQEDEAAILLVEKEREIALRGNFRNQEWMETFQKYKDLKALDRRAIVELIDRIYISEQKCVEIHFRYADEYEAVENYLRGIRMEESTDGEKKQKKTG